jgi:hypothetical protein
MAIYTLSINFIDGATENKSHLLNVFYKFPNPDNEYKAAMDRSKKLLAHYSASAKSNNDFLTWLDWMSRKPEGFEIINVNVPDNISEEEMYLMIAAATNPHKKVIVGSHQYWQKHCYINNCNKIFYNNHEVTILDKDEAFQELNPKDKVTQHISITNNNMAKNNNPWISGSFYLFLAAVVIAGLAVASNSVNWILLPVIVIGGILIIGMVGILQLRNDEKIKDKSFVKLISETYKRLPLLNKLKPNDKISQN